MQVSKTLRNSANKLSCSLLKLQEYFSRMKSSGGQLLEMLRECSKATELQEDQDFCIYLLEYEKESNNLQKNVDLAVEEASDCIEEVANYSDEIEGKSNFRSSGFEIQKFVDQIHTMNAFYQKESKRMESKIKDSRNHVNTISKNLRSELRREPTEVYYVTESFQKLLNEHERILKTVEGYQSKTDVKIDEILEISKKALTRLDNTHDNEHNRRSASKSRHISPKYGTITFASNNAHRVKSSSKADRNNHMRYSSNERRSTVEGSVFDKISKLIFSIEKYREICTPSNYEGKLQNQLLEFDISTVKGILQTSNSLRDGHSLQECPNKMVIRGTVASKSKKERSGGAELSKDKHSELNELELKKMIIQLGKDKAKLEERCKDRKVSLKKLYFLVVETDKRLKQACEAIEYMGNGIGSFEDHMQNKVELYLKKIRAMEEQISRLAILTKMIHSRYSHTEKYPQRDVRVYKNSQDQNNQITSTSNSVIEKIKILAKSLKINSSASPETVLLAISSKVEEQRDQLEKETAERLNLQIQLENTKSRLEDENERLLNEISKLTNLKDIDSNNNEQRVLDIKQLLDERTTKFKEMESIWEAEKTMLKTRYHDAEKRLSFQSQQEVANLKQEKHYLLEKVDKLQNQIIQEQNKLIQAKSESRKELAAINQRLEKEYQEIEAKFEIDVDEYSKKLDESNAIIMELNSKISNLKSNLIEVTDTMESEKYNLERKLQDSEHTKVILNKSITQLKTELRLVQDQLELAKTATKPQNEDLLIKLKSSLADYIRTNSEANNRINELEDLVRELESHNGDEKIDELMTIIDNKEIELQTISKEFEDQKESLKLKFEEKIEEINRKNNNLISEIKVLQDQREERDQLIEENGFLLKEKTQEILDSKNFIQQLESQNEDLKKEIESSKGVFKELQYLNTTLEGRIKELEKSLSLRSQCSSDEVKNLELRINGLESELSSAKNLSSSHFELLNSEQEKCKSLDSKISSLTESISKNEYLIEELTTKLNQKEEINDEWESKSLAMEKLLKSKITTLEKTVEDLEQRIGEKNLLLEQKELEILDADMMHKMSESKCQELEKVSQKFDELHEERQLMINLLEEKNRNLLKLKKKEIRCFEEIDRLNSKIRELEDISHNQKLSLDKVAQSSGASESDTVQLLEELRNEIRSLKSSNMKLEEEKIKLRDIEIEDEEKIALLHKTIDSLNEKNASISCRLQEEKTLKETALKDLSKIALELKATSNNLQEQKASHDKLVELLERDMATLRSEHQVELEIACKTESTLKEKIEDLNKAIESHNSVHNSKLANLELSHQNDMDYLKDKYEQMMEQEKNKRRDAEKQYDIEKNQIVSQLKDIENENLKRSRNNHEIEISAQNLKFETESKKLIKEKDTLEEKISDIELQLSIQIKDNESQLIYITQLSNELAETNSKCKQSELELESLRKFSDSVTSDLNIKSSKIHEMEGIIRDLNDKIKVTEDLLETKQIETNTLIKEKQSLETSISLAKVQEQERQAIEKLLIDSQKSLELLTKQNSELDSKLISKNELIDSARESEANAFAQTDIRINKLMKKLKEYEELTHQKDKIIEEKNCYIKDKEGRITKMREKIKEIEIELQKQKKKSISKDSDIVKSLELELEEEKKMCKVLEDRVIEKNTELIQRQNEHTRELEAYIQEKSSIASQIEKLSTEVERLQNKLKENIETFNIEVDEKERKIVILEDKLNVATTNKQCAITETNSVANSVLLLQGLSERLQRQYLEKKLAILTIKIATKGILKSEERIAQSNIDRDNEIAGLTKQLMDQTNKVIDLQQRLEEFEDQLALREHQLEEAYNSHSMRSEGTDLDNSARTSSSQQGGSENQLKTLLNYNKHLFQLLGRFFEIDAPPLDKFSERSWKIFLNSLKITFKDDLQEKEQMIENADNLKAMLNIKCVEVEELTKKMKQLKGFVDRELSISEIGDDSFSQKMKGFLGDSQIKVELEATEDNAKEQGVSSHEAEKYKSRVQELTHEIEQLMLENEQLEVTIRAYEKELKEYENNENTMIKQSQIQKKEIDNLKKGLKSGGDPSKLRSNFIDFITLLSRNDIQHQEPLTSILAQLSLTDVQQEEIRMLISSLKPKKKGFFGR